MEKVLVEISQVTMHIRTYICKYICRYVHSSILEEIAEVTELSMPLVNCEWQL